MSLVSIYSGELAFGDMPLLDGADLFIEARERIGLIGRNGTGKSSLLSIIAGLRELDDGDLRIAVGTRIQYVEQEPVLPPADCLRDSLAERMGLRQDHGSDREYWGALAKLEAAADRFAVDLQAAIDGLSGGERKRASLAAALAREPELLLLDEPTNHLDIAAIEQLEGVLLKGPTLIVITHDRRFLDNVANRIIELDRGQLRSYPGNFAAYEQRKQEQLADEAVQSRRFDKFWKAEEVWIRQGVQARRTRDEGRVRRLEALRSERAQRRARIGSVNMQIDASERSGKLVAELEHVTKHFGDKRAAPVVSDFSTILKRGDRVGFIGPNGAGKTTLLKLITGALEPDSGTIKLGTKLQVAYFDQMRAQLDPDKTVIETISPGSEWIEVNDQRKHVVSYLGDFLFSPRRAASPVSTLSGGERNRLLLARLFARPANLLVLDEPTNDLDIESLDILESTLQEYTGTLLLVSHDRAFLDAVVTQTIAFEGNGTWREYPGGYTDWVHQSKARRGALAQSASHQTNVKTTASKTAANSLKVAAAPKVKLTYKESRELQQLPDIIAKLESEQQTLNSRMGQADYYSSDAQAVREDAQRVQEIETELLKRLERWEALEAMSDGNI